MRILLLLLAVAVVPAAAAERRCGWLANPTPANWWLTDGAGEWTIGEQGGYQAPGMDAMPDMSARGWIKTNGEHGYGCACMTVESDHKAMRITRVLTASPRPLKLCRADRALRRP